MKYNPGFDNTGNPQNVCGVANLQETKKQPQSTSYVSYFGCKVMIHYQQLSHYIQFYQMVNTKNSKSRTISLAPSVIKVLRRIKAKQLENRLRYGECWTNSGFVFTDDLGNHLSASSVYKAFKRVVEEIGSPETRFHDLRHSYAVAAIRSGDDIKTVQENLGHAPAA